MLCILFFVPPPQVRNAISHATSALGDTSEGFLWACAKGGVSQLLQLFSFACIFYHEQVIKVCEEDFESLSTLLNRKFLLLQIS